MAIEVYLDSILINFLTNAIKYRSSERPCHIELSSEFRDGMLLLSIKDNGVGIDLEAHGHQLFSYGQTFHQGNDARGIGLFITKNHIESLGGHVTVESEVGVGTTFKIAFLPGK